MDTIFIPHSDYLEHHGIKGQKWGLRRYQNSDGSLTDAGKKRYNKQLAKAFNKHESKIWKESGVVGLAAARKVNNPNTTHVREKMDQDPDYQKAAKKYWDAYDELEAFGEHMYNKYGVHGKANAKEEKRRESLIRKANKAAIEEGDAWLKTVAKYEPELLSAKLKDIGVEDTEVGREFIKQVYETKHKNHKEEWWLM